MALPQAIDIRISMLRLVPQCFAFTSIYTDALAVLLVHVGLAQARPNYISIVRFRPRGHFMPGAKWTTWPPFALPLRATQILAADSFKR